MRARLLLLPRAEIDFQDVLDYIDKEAGVEIASRFDDAFFESLERLTTDPLIGADRSFFNQNFSGVRMWPINGFERILIFYSVENDIVRILRVLHSSRDTESIIFDEDELSRLMLRGF